MKPKVNPYLERIPSFVGDQDPSRAVRNFVRTKLNTSETLEVLAGRLGVNEITEEKLPFEGGLFREADGRLLIKLNSLSTPSRRRFTLAHEIGHLLLGTVPGHRSTRKSDAALERACDSIAAELLMPTEQSVSFVRSLGSPSPENLRTVASKYAVSLHTAAIRVHDDFKLWNCVVGLWERHPKISTIWFVGRRRWDATEPDSYSLDLALSSNCSVRTNELSRRGPFTDPVQLNLLHLGGGRVLGLVAFVN